MNRKAQVPPQAIVGIIVVILLLAFLPALSEVFKSMSCEDEKEEINNLRAQLSSCQSSNNNYRNSLNQCLDKLNKSNETCEEAMQNLITEYELKLQKNEIVVLFKNKFRVFLLSLIIPFSLLSISIKLGLKKKSEKILFFVKFLIWMSYLIILVVAYEDFFRAFFGI